MKLKKLTKPLYNLFFKKKKRRKSNTAQPTKVKAVSRHETPQRKSMTSKYDLEALRKQVSETEYIANLRIGRSWVLPQMVKMGFVKSGRKYDFDMDAFEKQIRDKYGITPKQRNYVWELIKRNYRDIANSNGADKRAKWWTKEVLLDIMEWDFGLTGYKTRGFDREECKKIINNVRHLDNAKELSVAIDWYDVNRMRYRPSVWLVRYGKGKSVPMVSPIPYSFIDAYMGDGAYNAMMTMVNIYGLRIEVNGECLDRDGCIRLIDQKANECSGKELMQFCKETFFDSNLFDYNSYIA